MAMTIKVSKLKPLAGYVLVEPAPVDKKTASGIISTTASKRDDS